MVFKCHRPRGEGPSNTYFEEHHDLLLSLSENILADAHTWKVVRGMLARPIVNIPVGPFSAHLPSIYLYNIFTHHVSTVKLACVQ